MSIFTATMTEGIKGEQFGTQAFQVSFIRPHAMVVVHPVASSSELQQPQGLQSDFCLPPFNHKQRHSVREDGPHQIRRCLPLVNGSDALAGIEVRTNASSENGCQPRHQVHVGVGDSQHSEPLIGLSYRIIYWPSAGTSSVQAKAPLAVDQPGKVGNVYVPMARFHNVSRSTFSKPVQVHEPCWQSEVPHAEA